MSVKVFKIAFGCLIAGILGLLIWTSFGPEDVFQSARNDMGVAGDCEVVWGDDLLWKFSIKPGESISRFSLVGFPQGTGWKCNTAKGVVEDSLGTGCSVWPTQPRSIILYIPAPPTDAFC